MLCRIVCLSLPSSFTLTPPPPPPPPCLFTSIFATYLPICFVSLLSMFLCRSIQTEREAEKETDMSAVCRSVLSLSACLSLSVCFLSLSPFAPSLLAFTLSHSHSHSHSLTHSLLSFLVLSFSFLSFFWRTESYLFIVFLLRVFTVFLCSFLVFFSFCLPSIYLFCFSCLSLSRLSSLSVCLPALALTHTPFEVKK